MDLGCWGGAIIWDQLLDQIEESVKMFMDLESEWQQRVAEESLQHDARKAEKY